MSVCLGTHMHNPPGYILVHSCWTIHGILTLVRMGVAIVPVSPSVEYNGFGCSTHTHSLLFDFYLLVIVWVCRIDVAPVYFSVLQESTLL